MNFIKKASFCSLLFISFFLLNGCAALPITFDVPVSSKSTIEQKSLVEKVIGSFGFNDFTSFDITQSQEFKNNNAEKKHVHKARIKSFTLTIIAPTTQNFDFLTELSFFVEAPGLEKKRIAHKKVPKGVKTFKFDLDDVELKPYVQSDKISITANVKGNRPDKETTIEAKIVFAIEAVL